MSLVGGANRAEPVPIAESSPRGQQAILAQFAASKRPGAIARAYLESVRAELAERHFAGASGSDIVSALTAAMDELLRALFYYADAEHGRRFTKLNQKLAVVARGGYGRGELNPQSDVDLLFLHDYKRGPYAEVVTEIILHALWDAGLTVGYGVRAAKECVRLANEDLKEKTAILDARFLCGDEKLYADLDKLLVADVLNRNQDKFFATKLEASRKRHAQYGDSIYLLEPQIKEGEGGLRDLHTAMWLAKVKYKVHCLEELVQRAVITEPEAAEVIEARDFLWRVRNSLHFLTGRHFDQLTFEMQERIEPMLGFKPEEGQAAGSALMRAYYQHASTVHRFAEGLIARVTENSSGGRFFRRTPTRKIRPGVIVQRNLLSIADRDFFKRDPLNLITIYADCQAQNVSLSGSGYQLVRDNLELIDEAMRKDPRVGAALMKILSARQRVAETLEAMHLSGVLGAIIPEFGNLYARVLHDLYHIYTVDRHSLVAVRELERLRTGEFKDPTPLLTEVVREFDHLPLVFLALLLHDIGKGHGHDHHERGAGLTAQVSQRLGLSSEEIDRVVFLVRNHLLMSQIAQKGDLDDHTTVEEFARTVGSINRLKALYLLTYADMRAVAPKVYNNWRDMLLGDLYMRALKVLEQGDREAVEPARRLATVKAAVRATLLAAGAPEADVTAFLDQMPDRYFFTVPEADIALHFDLMRSLEERPLVCRIRHFPELEFSEFIVVTRDQPGLFSMIAGALTANNLNILSARITTRTNGVAMDVFRVSHWMGAGSMAMEEDRWLRVEHDLERVITGQQEIAELVAAAHHVQSSGRKFVRHVPTEVTVDNRTSEQFTVIDVFTQDRVGLLFAITHTLYRLGLLIHLARISTNADQALDVFYVSDREGGKIEDLDRMRELRAALLEKVEQDPGAGATA
ncbi:[protein-PII] uridylyltransferase [Candidatus Binatus sp.]|uniref:[protein-PII] uridylyltransferase n=1 Tax=Candidatus Binatus sp. TaxID=2811406 RepID=UPI002F92B6FA